MSSEESKKTLSSTESDATKSATNNDPSTQSYTGMASSAAGSAAETATNAAAGVKDTMFSMFGGGSKKDTKADKPSEDEDRSGSQKALKEKEKAQQEQEGSKEGDNPEEGVGGSLTLSSVYIFHRRTSLKACYQPLCLHDVR